jgi:hypothetical protein
MQTSSGSASERPVKKGVAAAAVEDTEIASKSERIPFARILSLLQRGYAPDYREVTHPPR